MEGTLTLLLFAGLFFLMMRYGCGAHMAHGHQGHDDKADSKPVVDPVCGMAIEDDQGYGKLHEATLYRFCSKKCLDEFDQQPEKYIQQEHHHEA